MRPATAANQASSDGCRRATHDLHGSAALPAPVTLNGARIVQEDRAAARPPCPGSRIASTWSPASSWVSSSGISALPSRTTEIRRAPFRQLQRPHALALAVRGLVDRHLDDLEVLLAQLEQLDQPVLRHLVLDQRHDRRRSRETVGEMPSRSKYGWLRGSLMRAITLRDAVLLARELADDDVVLVVAGRRDEQVGRALDAGALEHEELGRVAADHLVLELGLELVEAVRASARSASPRGPRGAASA